MGDRDHDGACPACGWHNRAGVIFCSHCGTRLLMQQSTCAFCGQSVQNDERFCGQCGAPLATSAPAVSGPVWPAGSLGPVPPAGPAVPAPAARPRTPGWLLPIVVAALIVVVGGSVGGYFLARHTGNSGVATPPSSYGLSVGASSSTSSSETTSASTTSSTTTSSASTTTTEPPFVQRTGEILLEPASNAGPESFTGETFVPAGPTSTLLIPTSTTSLTTTSTTETISTGSTQSLPATGTTGPLQVASYPADTPALYGGSKSKTQVDKEGQLRFFERNPDKAAAFCAALNSDPTFEWSGGTQIQPSQLRDYFAELTPVMLTRDTRVTNYGYRNGRPTPRQSVLQAGQMVLVDRFGVPRVRCECGNPLTPPIAVSTAPTYTGPRWRDFDPTVIVVVQPTVVIIQSFVLIDIYTGDMFERPVGTDGARDTVRRASVWDLQVQVHEYDVLSWRAQVTLNPDGTLSGSTKAVWHERGYSYVDKPENHTGTWEEDINYSVTITGTVETTAGGRVLHIKAVPTVLSLENWAIVDNTADHALVRADVERKIPGWLSAAFAPLDLPAVDYGPVFADFVASDGQQGSATLTALK